jgi:rhodanese-related sulfurtransferase
MATGPKAISTQMLTNLVNREDGVVVDIRGANDFNKGHIHGALNMPLSKIKESTKNLEKYKNKPIIMVCANGISVSAACSILSKSGMDRVFKLQGGMSSWTGDKLPVVK